MCVRMQKMVLIGQLDAQMDEDKPEDEQVADGRALLLDDFLSQTGTAFMDDMFPRKRKSMAPAGMGDATGPQGPPTLADQVVAAGSLVPQLEMYQFVRCLASWTS